jgi:hypothetical protein
MTEIEDEDTTEEQEDEEKGVEDDVVSTIYVTTALREKP